MYLHVFDQIIAFSVNDAIPDDVGDFYYNDNGGPRTNQHNLKEIFKDFYLQSIKKNIADCTKHWCLLVCNSDTLFHIRQVTALMFHDKIYFEGENWERFIDKTARRVLENP